MSTAASLHDRNENIRLLSCFDFLRERQQFPYPIEFKLAALKQFSKPHTNLESRKSFGYKIFKTFRFNKQSITELYKTEPQLVKSFLNSMDHITELVELSKYLSQLSSPVQKVQYNQTSHEETDPARPSCSNITRPNHVDSERESKLSNNIEDSIPPAQDYTSNYQTSQENQPFVTQAEEVLGKISGFNPDLSDLREMFICYQKQDEGCEEFLKLLKTCERPLKEQLNPVTWSFFKMKVVEMDWPSCFLLFQNLSNVDFETVESFIGENENPVSLLFSMIEGCLESNYVREAVMVFVFCDFHKSVDDWKICTNITQECFSRYKALLGSIEKQIQNFLNDPNKNTDEIKDTLMGLVDKQKSLKKPIDLKRCVAALIDRLILERDVEEAANIVMELIDNKHRKDLLMKSDSFRIMVNKLVEMTKGVYASCVMLKASSLLLCCYPMGLNHVGSTEVLVASCLTKNEMLCIVQTKSYYCGINTCRKFTFQKRENSKLVSEVLGYFPCDIPAAMRRFEEILRLHFDNSCIIRNGDSLIIDNVVIEHSNAMDTS